MFSWSRPDDAAVRRVLDEADQLNYAEVGLTRDGAGTGRYTCDRYGCTLGVGEAVFAAARGALDRFAMYPPTWTRVVAPRGVAVDARFATVVRHLGFWSVNPCRILDIVDEPTRSGFAFGTLRGHAERGEERFEIRWDRSSDAVSYHVLAFSRPAHPLARLGAPIARAYQLRFQRDTTAAMRRAVGTSPT